jgi:hypothetical protein
MSFIFIEESTFTREFKKLQRNYPSLPEDFKILKTVLCNNPTAKNASKHAATLYQNEQTFIIKIRMMCRSLRGRSLRVIYCYNGERIEFVFLEIYYKGKKENEDTKRIENFLQNKK